MDKHGMIGMESLYYFFIIWDNPFKVTFLIIHFFLPMNLYKVDFLSPPIHWSRIFRFVMQPTLFSCFYPADVTLGDKIFWHRVCNHLQTLCQLTSFKFTWFQGSRLYIGTSSIVWALKFVTCIVIGNPFLILTSLETKHLLKKGVQYISNIKLKLHI